MERGEIEVTAHRNICYKDMLQLEFLEGVCLSRRSGGRRWLLIFS